MVGDTCVAGSPEALDACLADDVSSALFVIGGDVADPLRKPHRVVVVLDAFQFDVQHGGGVVDRFEMWPLVFDVAEECFDPGLIGRCVRPSMMLGHRIAAMNWQVAYEVIAGQLSDTASIVGSSAATKEEPGPHAHSGPTRAPSE